jgi:hypothetical protein
MQLCMAGVNAGAESWLSELADTLDLHGSSYT